MTSDFGRAFAMSFRQYLSTYLSLLSRQTEVHFFTNGFQFSLLSGYLLINSLLKMKES